MAEAEETAFLEFMETERSASPRTLDNYRRGLEAYRGWRGGKFSGWRDETADDFRDYLYELMKEGMQRATNRLRFPALRSF